MRALLLAALALSTPAFAEQLCHTQTVPLTPTTWTTTASIPRFDPAVGTLNAVHVAFDSTIQGDAALESTELVPSTFDLVFCADVSVRRPDQSLILSIVPVQWYTENLGAFDGTVDFAGASGVTHAGVVASTSGQQTLSSLADLALFSGAGSIALPVGANNTAFANGPGAPVFQFVQSATTTLTVCYEYTPVGAPFCLGDGSGTACPCGNASAPAEAAGCVNSTGAAAALRGTGAASVAADTYELSCTGLPATTTALFFQGDAAWNGGAGSVFGDGLRCAGGFVVRLGTHAAVSGVASYPQAGDAPVSVRGAVPANTTRVYQVWYRNVASFCTSAAFNLSQGLSVAWQS